MRKANTIFPYIEKLPHKSKEKVISLEVSLKKTTLLVKIQRKLIHFWPLLPDHLSSVLPHLREIMTADFIKIPAYGRGNN